jgi:hypothetical protein
MEDMQNKTKRKKRKDKQNIAKVKWNYPDISDLLYGWYSLLINRCFDLKCFTMNWKVWWYQRSNQKPSFVEGQTLSIHLSLQSVIIVTRFVKIDSQKWWSVSNLRASRLNVEMLFSCPKEMASKIHVVLHVLHWNTASDYPFGIFFLFVLVL